MADRVDFQILSRRAFVLSGAAAMMLPAFLARAEDDPEFPHSDMFKEELKNVLKGATPVEGKIAIDLPETAENGNFVPLTIQVDSPMTAEDHVKTVHLLSTGNPFARVATFHLKPINAVARIQSRMRLAKTQDVFVAAEMSDGSIAVSSVMVKVTIGGCGG